MLLRVQMISKEIVARNASSKVRKRCFGSLALITPRAWGLVFLSAFLQVLSFPVAGPLPYWRTLIAWFCLVPFLVAIFTPDRKGAPISPLAAASLGYSCGILWYAGNCYWIYQTMYLYGALPKPVSAFILVLFSMYLGFTTRYSHSSQPGFAACAGAPPEPCSWLRLPGSR